MEQYKIVSITHNDGTPRTDGRYPKRIGRICYKPKFETIDVPLYIDYIKDENGKDYRGYMFRTSKIRGFSVTERKIVVKTMNSIYTFEKVEKEPRKIVIEINGCQSEDHFHNLKEIICNSLEGHCPFNGLNVPSKCCEDYCEDCLKEQVVIRSSQYDLPYK